MAPDAAQNVFSPIYHEKETLSSLFSEKISCVLVDELKSKVFFKIVKKVFSIF